MRLETADPSAAPTLDEHDRRLLAEVRPPDWVNPEPRRRYDLVVLGAGTAGLVCAAGAAGLGARVALVERALMGGDCLVTGCVPSKAMIAAARVWHTVRNGEELGAPATIGGGDFARVMERMRRLRADLAPHDGAARFRELGVDVFFGAGRFAGPETIEVEGKALRFKRAVLATGARAVVPPIAGLVEAGFVTHETLFALAALPRRLAIVGAGPVGCELAQAFGRLGAQVTLFDALPRVLPGEDEDASALIAEVLRRESVRLELGTTIEEVQVKGAHKVLRFARPGAAADRVAVDEILVAAGRAPRLDGLELAAAGIASGEHGLQLDERLRTTNRRVYACGDVASPLRFTHAADAQARLVLRNAFFGGRRTASALLVPSCTYTEPEVARVGLLATGAAAHGLRSETIRVPLADVDRARLDGQTDGFLKLEVERRTGRILGGTVVAPHAGDLLAELCVAMQGGVRLGALAEVVHPYPTLSELVKRAADAWNRRRLTPRARALLRWRFRLLR